MRLLPCYHHRYFVFVYIFVYCILGTVGVSFFLISFCVMIIYSYVYM